MKLNQYFQGVGVQTLSLPWEGLGYFLEKQMMKKVVLIKDPMK